MTISGKGAKTATRMISAPSAGSTGREENENTISLFAFGSPSIRRRFGVLSWVRLLILNRELGQRTQFLANLDTPYCHTQWRLIKVSAGREELDPGPL